MLEVALYFLCSSSKKTLSSNLSLCAYPHGMHTRHNHSGEVNSALLVYDLFPVVQVFLFV